MSKKRGQNEGSIRQRSDGSWEARYTVGVDMNGKQMRKLIYGKTKTEVLEKLTKVLNDLAIGVYVGPSKLTLSDWLDTWLEQYKRERKKQRRKLSRRSWQKRKLTKAFPLQL